MSRLELEYACGGVDHGMGGRFVDYFQLFHSLLSFVKVVTRLVRGQALFLVLFLSATLFFQFEAITFA